MAEYIDREALIQQMADNFRQGVWDGCDCGEYQIAETTILCAPAADVVEVVRCKDCKWFGEIGCAISIVDDSDKPTELDFCSFGERKEDA